MRTDCASQWELVPGSDLLDFLNEHGGRLPESLAAHIFQQLVTAVRTPPSLTAARCRKAARRFSQTPFGVSVRRFIEPISADTASVGIALRWGTCTRMGTATGT